MAEEYLTATSQRDLAAGILKQATQDLRRFHAAKNALERELYRDAYSWLTSDDEAWPFSFLKVCQLLSLAPEIVREELLRDHSLGLFSYYVRRCGHAAHTLQSFLGNTFTSGRDAKTTDRHELVPIVH